MPIITQNLACAITSLELASELGQPTSFQAKLAVEELRDVVRAMELGDAVVFAQVDMFQTVRDYEKAFDELVDHRRDMRARWGTE